MRGGPQGPPLFLAAHEFRARQHIPSRPDRRCTRHCANCSGSAVLPRCSPRSRPCCSSPRPSVRRSFARPSRSATSDRSRPPCGHSRRSSSTIRASVACTRSAAAASSSCGRRPQAIESFLKAVHLNHALPGSWEMLEGLYRMQGDQKNAATAGSHVATLRRLPQEVVLATGLFLDGDLEAAEALVRAFLLKHGDHIEAMRLLARIGIAHKIYFDAQVLLAAAARAGAGLPHRAPGIRVRAGGAAPLPGGAGATGSAAAR